MTPLAIAFSASFAVMSIPLLSRVWPPTNAHPTPLALVALSSHHGAQTSRGPARHYRCVSLPRLYFVCRSPRQSVM
jgi:hypothetical protein